MNSRLLVSVAALAVCAACSSPARSPSLAGKADTTAEVTFAPSTVAANGGGSGIDIFATLAPLGSFEWTVAPRYTALAVARHSAAAQLRKGKITVAQAQAVQAKSDEVRGLLDAAVAACAQNDKTGQCTKDSRRAHQLLSVADAKLASIK